MRTFVLALGFGLALAAVTRAEGPPGDRDAVTGTVFRSPGSARVTLHDPSDDPFGSPAMRLVDLPPGAVNPRITSASGASNIEISAGDPMILRGVTVVPVRVGPRDPSARRDFRATDLAFDVEYDDRAGAGSRRAAVPPGRGFFAPYGDLLMSESARALGGVDEGGYLIVTAPGFLANLQPLVDWKRELGFDVTVATTDETGTTNVDIRAWVTSFYASAEVAPQYLLLVGDVDQLPGFDYHQSISDLPYGLVDGTDFLPDIDVGRLPVQTTSQLDTIVAKILRYEQDPYRGSGDAWFVRGLVVGGDVGSATPRPVSRWCREQLLSPEVGFAAVDTVYYPPWGTLGVVPIRNSINTGTSIVSYRGWAYGVTGWESPRFDVEDIAGLSNGWMLPAVFSFVCLNGDFAADEECFGEAWLRAGSATDPKGAVGFIGNSEHWSHTRFNDAAAIGAFGSIRRDGTRRLGQVLNAAKAEILHQYPDMLTYDPWTDESVEFYYYIYSLLGDPSLEIWTAAPRTITVAHADSIPVGSTMLEISVHEEDGSTPVAGARVGVSQGATVIGQLRTDSSGHARLLASFEDASSPVRISVTGGGVAPYRGSLVVVADAPYLALTETAVDGDVNPGEARQIAVRVANRGPSAATGVTGTLASFGGATVQVGAVTFPDVASGGSEWSSESFLIAVDEDAIDGQVIRANLEVTSGTDVSSGGFDLAVLAPALRHEAHSLDGDGVLDPGETASLTPTVLNEGSIPASASQAVLRTATPALVTVTDSTAAFDAIAVGLSAAATTPFTIVAADSAAIGQAAAFTLAVTTVEGYVSNTSFSVAIGTADHRAPQGPDDYGYYAYDSSDTDYPATVPTYEWIPCSPTYGGSGTAIPLANDTTAVVALPFPFTFYGQTYDSLLVSDNGWVSFEIAPYKDYYNWSLPNAYGAGAQLAAFWDNLDPTKEYDGQRVGDGIYWFDDTANHRFVVEWSRLGNVRSHHSDEGRPDYDELQTFEIVLFDPAHHPTPSGDGIVRFQYKQIVNNDWERMYATVGIENGAEDDGLQYTYTNLYPPEAAPLSAGLAIDFSTRPPRYAPFRFTSFAATGASSGVLLEWTPSDDRPRAATQVYRATPDGEFRLVRGGRLRPEVDRFLDEDADPDATLRYRVGSVDAVGRETLFGPFVYKGDAPPTFPLSLAISGANPAPGAIAFRYSLPRRTDVRLRVYSVTGRLVRTLVHAPADAGEWTAPWDGRDDRGAGVASGVYFARLESADGVRSLKVTWLR